MSLNEKILFDSGRKEYYDRILYDISKYRNVAIWGAARGGKKFFDIFNRSGLRADQQVFFVDNASAKIGRCFCGIPVYRPDVFLSLTAHNTVTVITCAASDAVRSQLSGLFDGKVLSLDAAWHDFDMPFENYYSSHRDEFDRVYTMLADELSRRTMEAVLNYRINHEPHYLTSVISDGPEYFDPTLLTLGKNEVFVDGGAYTGDTVQTFISSVHRQYRRVICFEPDESNFGRLSDYVWASHLPRVFCYRSALGAASGKVLLDTKTNNGASSGFISTDGDTPVEETALDSVLEASDASLIKLDVEGYEMPALNGMRRIIKDNRPKLAVCVYHKYEDMIGIPSYLKQLVPEYQIYLRHYSPTAFETICYAVP